MSEVSVGAWNAQNSFGDQRVSDALEVVKEMDSDVLYLSETTTTTGANTEYFAEASCELESLGYRHQLITNYGARPETRDEHTMSLWSRVGGDDSISRQTLGSRYGTKLSLDSLGVDIYGVHFDDASTASRLESADILLGNVSSSQHEAVVMGDLNSMNRADPKSFLPRALGLAVARFEPKDFYNDENKVQRFVGKVVRVCRMAGGQTVQRLLDAGFMEADDSFQDTISVGRIAFQIDHILTTARLEVSDFARHDQTRLGRRTAVSDHHPISATVRR